MIELFYLTDIPQSAEKYGICKTFAVRKEIIHIKHIFTEVFVRKSIDINFYLEKINWNLFNYVEFLTNRLRHIHNFSRSYTNNINSIIKSDKTKFFPTIDLYKGLNNLIVLDFDGVVTEKSFEHLYKLCLQTTNTEICSANPIVSNEWFLKRNLPIPNKIHACKGKIAKIKKLIELSKKKDYIFYIDNEKEYLEFAWLFGIQTYFYNQKQIKYFSLNSSK